ncbi:glycolate oxidase subunit GlcE [Ottowia sp.]|uniref:glycolate oxidase subunit GlcE n=1 Tax=Ottowia sp. TaxID=1898956 RepID=UPI002C964EC7|nr:glycolate oxidase subunit GlcE [Ottowia sp.]HOB67984.1 glycolate oxidase subunit GlcE [Ottowia sp.]HPZ57107.1 glycolate oxidase subunit GlcE [Ottowia sp.]HQD47948.1 glycolate oxidase subunit GlcE [Ottowia sp.]
MDAALHALTDKIRKAADRGRPLRIRGGGSKDFYGQDLHGELLDVRPLGGVVAYEPSELVVTVRAGTRLRDLEAVLAEAGQCLPFEPPRFGTGGTVGGMVAAGLSGPARASAGAVRDYVLGVQVLNGRGQLLTFGGQVMKNVAGYDVSRLLAGSLGTLGVITEVSLKVLPVPPAERTLLFELSETSARQQLNRWGGQPLPLNASCWADGQLAVRLRGAHAAIASAAQQMGGHVLDDERAQRQWTALRDQALPFFRLAPGEALWRASVPDTATPLNLGPTLVEWHGAQRWIKATPQDEPRVREAAARAGGHATLFRGGDGVTPVFTPLAAPLARIHAQLKREFDPAGILCPGRLYPDF